MELTVVPIVKPADANFIFGQSHFITTVEDLHEALVGTVPRIRFGLAFCEASGKRLVRWSGNDETSLTLARNNALAIGSAWWMAPRRWVSKPTPTLRGGKTCCERSATSCSGWMKPKPTGCTTTCS
ncbi:hypothetical protein V1293_004184 [Bradyrhizobium sp. AZCC 1693]